MITYPVPLLLSGMLLLVISTATAGEHAMWLFPMLLVGIYLPAALGRLRLLAVTALGMLAARLIIQDMSLLAAVLYVAGVGLLATGASALCPRCATHISSRDQWWRGGPRAEWCYVCGRTRRRVWPFQYALKPEDWDGEYHDEGGGPSSVDSIVDWMRYNAFRRWQKRHHRT